jgi:hypothetical protein
MRASAVIRGRVRRQDGQVLPLVMLFMVVLIGFAAFVIDVGRLYIAHNELQGAVNAAALNASQNLPDATDAVTDGVNYGGATGEKNALSGNGISANAPSVTFACFQHAPNYTSTSSPACPTNTGGTAVASCPSATGCNAVTVTETATVKTTFAGLFIRQWNISASATAAERGSTNKPVNVYVILDNTQSMTDSCGASVTGNGNPTNATLSSPTKLDCAKAGVRALLQALAPCGSNLASCGTATANTAAADGTPQLGANVPNPVDEAGLLVIPAITVSSPASSTPVGDEINCAGSGSTSTFADEYPPWSSYTYSKAASDGGIPSSDDYLGYQAVGLSSDFRSSYASTSLNWTSSAIVEADDWGQCTGSVPPSKTGNYYPYGLKDIGGHGSYLAGAITEAQHLIDQNARDGAVNAIIIESDGEMTDPVTFSNDSTRSNTTRAAVAVPTTPLTHTTTRTR